MEQINSLSLLFIGCDNSIESDELEIQQKSESAEGCDFAVHGIYFDNGVPANSPHNMLHFPSWDSFEATIDMLDAQVDAHEDSFVIPNDHLSEDDLNDLEESSGFEEDQPLIDFENSHEFKSLRSVLRAAEDDWLDQSDQPGWSYDDDPDNTALIFGTERTFYNPQNEVMICSYIFKKMVDGLLTIDISNVDATDALAMANEGSTAQEVMDEYGGTVEEPNGISVQIYQEDLCLYHLKDSKWFDTPNPDRKVKAIHLISGSPEGGEAFFLPEDFKWKAWTFNFKWRNGKLRKRRVSSWAGIYGDIHDNSGLCGTAEPVADRCTKKKRRRRKEVIRRASNLTIRRGADINALESRHRQLNTTYVFPYDL